MLSCLPLLNAIHIFIFIIILRVISDDTLQKTGYLIHYLICGRINITLMVVVEVVLILGPPSSPPRKFIFGLMGVILCHLRLGCFQYHCSLEAIRRQPSWMILS